MAASLSKKSQPNTKDEHKKMMQACLNNLRVLLSRTKMLDTMDSDIKLTYFKMKDNLGVKVRSN